MRRTRSRDQGASLVEFALVVPILTLFLFAIIQFGLAYDKKQSINSAAREGARTAAIPVSSVDDIETAVENSFQGLVTGDVVTTVKVGATTFTPGSTTEMPCDGNAGSTVIVESHVDHVLTIPFYGAPTLDLQGRGEFRCERS